MSIGDPERYEAWYHTPRGTWIGNKEYMLITRLMKPVGGSSLLDVGSGTGYFSRRFARDGLQVTGLDPDIQATGYAARLDGSVSYLSGSATSLPFDDSSFDYCTAVTTLCFIVNVDRALTEMWRVSRRGVVLGLLNRRSLLHKQKHQSGSYRSARWDDWPKVANWCSRLVPPPRCLKHRTAIFFPGGGGVERLVEWLLPGQLPWGGFLAAYLGKPEA